MSATLEVTRRTIGVAIRRGPLQVVLDDRPVGSVGSNHTIEVPIDPGHHSIEVRYGGTSSRTLTFDAGEGDVVAFRCSGKRPWPLLLASLVVRDMGLSLRRV